MKALAPSRRASDTRVSLSAAEQTTTISDGSTHQQVMERREPGAPWHNEVERYDLRVELVQNPRGFQAVPGLANDLVPSV